MSFELIRTLCRTVFASGHSLRLTLAAALGVVVAFLPGETQNAVANGDTRTIQLYHAHTHESITATFLVDGSYDNSVLEKLNWFLRDWRRDEPTKMDPKLFDVIWEVYRESGSRQPIEVMSAYRSPETNAMLRRRSRQVAEHSQHILGKAMDQHYMDVSMSRIREIAMRLQRGGVGFYPTAGTPFVHMDVGGVRHWPRMSYDQLARLFPDGKTVHIPSNGQPLPGYEEARAELEARGGGDYPTATQLKSKGFFAWLFGGSDEEEDVAAEGGGRGAEPSRNGRTQVADRGTGPSTAYSPVGKDGGMHSFIANQAPQPAPTTPYGRMARDAASTPMPAPVQASVQTPAPAQGAPAPSPEADQTLATAMAADAVPAGRDSTPPVRSVPDLAVPTQALSANGLGVPTPPRRPVELASDSILPLPPSRPAELSRPVEAPAPTPSRTARGDAIGAMIAGRTSAGLPDMMRGSTSQPTAVQVLAYADTGRQAPANRPLLGSVPLPVARPPDLIGARLDRGNFHALTSVARTDRTATASLFGAALGVRAASRAAASAYASPLVPTRFGSHASNPDADRFSGQAVTAGDRITTSHRADAANPRSTAD